MTGNPGMILARCLQKSDKFAVPGMNLPEILFLEHYQAPLVRIAELTI